MINSIFVIILSFLLTFFPNNETILGYYQQAVFPGEQEVLLMLIDKINEKDCEGIKEMFSDYCKQNIPEIDEKIEALVNSVDSKLTYVRFDSGSGGSQTGPGYYKTVSKTYIVKDENNKTYTLSYFWVIANVTTKTKTGLGSIMLGNYNQEAENPYGEKLAIVSLSEGDPGYYKQWYKD